VAEHSYQHFGVSHGGRIHGELQTDFEKAKREMVKAAFVVEPGAGRLSNTGVISEVDPAVKVVRIREGEKYMNHAGEVVVHGKGDGFHKIK
jgi:hypothetical protein